jgi:hypothetical protein
MDFDVNIIIHGAFRKRNFPFHELFLVLLAAKTAKSLYISYTILTIKMLSYQHRILNL